MVAGAAFFGGGSTVGSVFFAIPLYGQVAFAGTVGIVAAAQIGRSAANNEWLQTNLYNFWHGPDVQVPPLIFADTLDIGVIRNPHETETPGVNLSSQVPITTMHGSGVSPTPVSPIQMQEAIQANMHARNQSIMDTAVAEARSFAASFELAGLKPEMLPEAWFQLAPGSNTWEASTALTNRAINEIASLHNSNDNNATRTVVFPYLTPSGVTIPLIVTGTSDQLTPWLYQSDVFLSSHLQASGILQSWFEPAKLPAMPSGEVPQHILNTEAIALIRENTRITNRMSSMEPTAIVQINNEFYSLSGTMQALGDYFEQLLNAGMVTALSLNADLEASGLAPLPERESLRSNPTTASPLARTSTAATPTPPPTPQEPMAVHTEAPEPEPLLPENVEALLANSPEVTSTNVTKQEAVDFLLSAIEQLELSESASLHENHDRGWREPFDNLAGRITGAGLSSQLAREQGALYNEILEALQNGSLTPAEAMQAAKELNRLAAAAGGEVAETREEAAHAAHFVADVTALALAAEVGGPLALRFARSLRLSPAITRAVTHPTVAPILAEAPVVYTSIVWEQLDHEGEAHHLAAALETAAWLMPTAKLVSTVPGARSLFAPIADRPAGELLGLVSEGAFNGALAAQVPLIFSHEEFSFTEHTQETADWATYGVELWGAIDLAEFTFQKATNTRGH